MISKQLLATILVAVAACNGKSSTPVTHKPLGSASPLSDRVLQQTKDLPDGIDLRVTEGKQGPPAFDRTKISPAEKLAERDANALLARAAQIKDESTDKQTFALRPASQPPPRTGAVIKGSFPAPASTLLPPKAADAGKELKVLRYMPEGDVPLAPELSVTFNHPMVAVTSQDDAATMQPVTLTPTPPGGRWRWLGTRTILFDPLVRFPQATVFKVEVPAGTKAATGEVLRDRVAFTFTTPPPKVVQSWTDPYGPQHLDVPIFVKFDQRIDAAAVLAQTRVLVNTLAVAIQPVADPLADKNLKPLVEAARRDDQDGRWIAFRTVDKFPKDAQITVEIGAGTPSAEGPLKTTAAQSFSFRTYPPLRVDRAECGWGGECRPNMPFEIVFNNPLDGAKFDDAAISITPEIGAPKINASGNYLAVSGVTQARTTYRVRIPASLTDVFGQTLGNDTTLTFSVGDAVPTFFGPTGMVVTDPSARRPTLDFFTTNYTDLKVTIRQVAPSDYDAYVTYLRNRWNRDHPPRLPGTVVFDQTMPTTKGHNKLVETSVDVTPALRNGAGNAIVFVTPSPWKADYPAPELIAWVQATKLGLDAYLDHDNLVGVATDLLTGKPAANVRLALQPFGLSATTDERGMATLALPASTGAKGVHYLTATRGGDVALLSDNNYYSEYGSWVRTPQSKSLAWYVIDDRKMYKPGEDVSFKGWLRALDNRKGGDVDGLASLVSSVAFTVHDSQGVQIFAGTAPVNAVGGFDAKFTLPKTPNLGHASISFEAHGQMAGSYDHDFQIEEFRRPEFAVAASASQGPHLVGGNADVTVSAKYYAGGPLPGAPVQWNVATSAASFAPPNRDDYIFGNWEPWWSGWNSFDDDDGSHYKPPRTWNLVAKTDATGAHVLHLDFLSIKPAMAMSVVATASVTDVNRQMWSSSSALLVHPSSAYAGIAMKRPFVDKGTPMELGVIGVDLDGKALIGSAIEVRSVRLDWEYKKGKYKQLEKDPQTCQVTTSKDATPCTFATNLGGQYRVTATIVDAQGRPNQTTLSYWVSGGEQPPEREVKQEVVRIIPDKKTYAPGNTAELLVQSPFYPAEGIVSWSTLR